MLSLPDGRSVEKATQTLQKCVRFVQKYFKGEQPMLSACHVSRPHPALSTD